MQMRASFTVQRVPLPPEQVAGWRASIRLLIELCEAYKAQQQAIPVEIPAKVKGDIHVEG
jgi:hypothetical protein